MDGASRAWGAATVAAVVVGTAGAFATLPTPDVTWLLHVAGELLDGGRLGVDVVENSPPVILWMKFPVILLSRHPGWDSWVVWTAAVALLGIGALATSLQAVKRSPSMVGSAEFVVAVLAVGLFLLPRGNFGQREHVAACLVVPWLFALAARLEGAAPPAICVGLVSLAGGLGLSIKPHFGLVWLAVAAVVLLRRRTLRALLAPELTGAALVPAFTIVATLALHPEWLGYARTYGPLYQFFGRENPLWVGLVGEGVEWSWIGLLGFLAFAPAIRPIPASIPVLAAGLAGFHAAAALQMKGWDYHFLPAGALGLVLGAAAGASAGWPGDRLARRVYRVAVPAALAFAAWGGASRAFRLVVNPGAKWAEADPTLPALLAEVRRSGLKETLLVLSTNIGSGFPLVHLSGAGWTSRHPSLWVLGAIYADELRLPGVVTSKPPAERGPEERRMLVELGEDIAGRPPTLVLAPKALPEAPRWAVSQRFAYEAYVGSLADGPLQFCTGASAPRPVGAYTVWRCR